MTSIRGRGRVGLALSFVLALPGAVAAETVTVFAAASLRDAFGAVERRFEAQSGIEVRTSFASSGTLARQIAQGAPADLYISANPQWMDHLEQRKTIDTASRVDLLRNALVLVTARDRAFADLLASSEVLLRALGDGRLAMGHPAHVPAGTYGRQALRSLGLWQAVESRIARAADVRAALALVTRSGAPLGIVYRSDAVASDGVRVVASFPPDSHPPIVYPAAIVPGGRTESAHRLLAFLRGAQARRALERFGFERID